VQRAYHARDRGCRQCHLHSRRIAPGNLQGLEYLAICMQCPPSGLNLFHFERLMINSLVWRFYECLLRSKAVGCESFELIPAKRLPYLSQ